MDTKIYFIREDDYLDHIDNKLEMYELLLELVRAARADLEAGETARAMRTLCSYENQANEIYEEWCIPDEYAESGDPDDLAQFMENELLPADGEGVEAADGESECAADRLLRALDGIVDNAGAMLSAISEIVGYEAEFDFDLDEYEGPENACAE